MQTPQAMGAGSCERGSCPFPRVEVEPLWSEKQEGRSLGTWAPREGRRTFLGGRRAHSVWCAEAQSMMQMAGAAGSRRPVLFQRPALGAVDLQNVLEVIRQSHQ